MLLIAGVGFSCDNLNRILDKYGDRGDKYKILEIGADDKGSICSVSYGECWDKYEEDHEFNRYIIECACEKFNYNEATKIISGIVSELSGARLIVVTPISFAFPWGPLNIIDMPVRELWISEELSMKDVGIVDICNAALLSINDLKLIHVYTHPAGCIDILKDRSLLELLERSILVSDVSHEIRGKWLIVRVRPRKSYCDMVKELALIK